LIDPNVSKWKLFATGIVTEYLQNAVKTGEEN